MGLCMGLELELGIDDSLLTVRCTQWSANILIGLHSF